MKYKKNKNDKIILGVESSCDETSVAVVVNGRTVLSNIISSQIDIHKIYGGVVPEIASRNHVKNIDVVFLEALKEAGIEKEDIDAVAVAYGSGLMGALIVGVSFAKTLAYILGVPLIAVNHIEGHIASNYISHQELKPPFLSVVVSGGHTALFAVETFTQKKLVESTSDDAIGEAFDKVARECGLAYPGGPNIQKQAELGEANIDFIKKPQSKNMSFSYSGLKTAVINYIHNKKQKGEEINVPNICASFQKQAVEIVSRKAIEMCKKLKMDKIVLAGGVSANKFLREDLEEKAKEFGIQIIYSPLVLCTDNAAMVASQGYFMLIENKGIADLSLSPNPNIPLE